MALSQLELAFRVGAGLFVIVAPTLLFLALWRGLESMRDDELVERARQRAENAERSSTEWSVGGSAVSVVPDSGASRAETVACPSCGTENRTGVTYCQACLGEIADP
ncbi:zinc ribbon domain-containing protein [Halomicroarcula limicola]|uniref:Zinc ribbon domain-containing protein n=1 Tax=Haloarcula limicola TaxID=1429915 RepID=A0A8J8C821_9EURY|nr:zinc ribbon domain-containing protein [Halomicroarcula limicola]MBV0925618.1 zinc ribbon domain-containing protein [Halomicroarcula limicola]